MTKSVTVQQAAEILRDAQDVWILTHRFPDGDTLGSAFALCRALRSLGKRAAVRSEKQLPIRYTYLWDGLETQEFEPAFICAVDVASSAQLGGLRELAERVSLGIDHHAVREDFADNLLLDAEASAAAMPVLAVIRALGVVIDRSMAEGIYTGIATDTGCFRYTNTSQWTHMVAADMMAAGARAGMINRLMFEIKSRARLELERLALGGLRFYQEGRIAVMPVTQEILAASGAEEDDLEGLTPLPRQIEGVWVGVTMRERADGIFKVSLRTGERVDAAAICAVLGGGGHVRAAGCEVTGTLDEAVDTMIATITTHWE